MRSERKKTFRKKTDFLFNFENSDLVAEWSKQEFLSAVSSALGVFFAYKHDQRVEKVDRSEEFIQ